MLCEIMLGYKKSETKLKNYGTEWVYLRLVYAIQTQQTKNPENNAKLRPTHTAEC